MQLLLTCNDMQIDGFLYGYQMILADDVNYFGNANQIFTGWPAVGFCFQSGDINIRPWISYGPYIYQLRGYF